MISLSQVPFGSLRIYDPLDKAFRGCQQSQENGLKICCKNKENPRNIFLLESEGNFFDLENIFFNFFIGYVRTGEVQEL